MTKLFDLRKKLEALRFRRKLLRWGSAWAALAVGLLWALAVVFLLDVAFTMNVVQRLLVIGLAAAGVIWAFYRFSRPLLGVFESEMDITLLVEKRQHINNDLAAALQFESPLAKPWGSSRLQQAVIGKAETISRDLNVFGGDSSRRFRRRGLLLIATLAAALFVTAMAPNYLKTFWGRLLLGSGRYPSKTTIEKIVVGRQSVLPGLAGSASPLSIKAPQGEPLEFVVQSSGAAPLSGEVFLTAVDGNRRRQISLQPMSLQQRLSRLQRALARLRLARKDQSIDTAGAWKSETASLLLFDAPQAALGLSDAAGNRAGLAKAEEEIAARIETLPKRAEQTSLYLGVLDNFVEPLRYHIELGDAWTDPVSIEIIPQPVVEMQLSAIAPKYARAVQQHVEPGARQISVLEGSEVHISLKSVNHKPLKEVWLLDRSAKSATRHSLARQDQQGLLWTLQGGQSPLAAVVEEVRFEIQVVDEDSLSLAAPLQGSIRLKADRPPTASAHLIHRVVLPGAKPVLEYRVADDYGVSRLSLHIQVQRSDNGEETTEPRPEDRLEMSLLADGRPLLGAALPHQGKYELDLAPLKLAKGDRLKLTLQATDYRGDRSGESYTASPLVLEISDESGVLAAISAADENSEQQLNEIIRQQLGIGESE